MTPAPGAARSRGTEPPPPDIAFSSRVGIRLPLILSGIALAAFALRVATQAQVMASAGASLAWPPILATETANWAGWSLWGMLLVQGMRRVVDRSTLGARQVATLAAMAVAPAVLVPLVASPVHWLGFGAGVTLAQAYLHMVTHNAPTSLLLGLTMVAVTNGYLGLQRARRLEVTAAHLNTELTLAQLDTLRSQLNPHFLFNALNSIAVLARRGQMEPVEQMVTRLAGLLRHSLDSASTQLVPMRVEVEALQHYVGIEQVRHGDRLEVRLEIPAAVQDQLVPSFLIQPLVENAIRHGLTDPHRPLRVTITATVEARELVVEVVDDGTGIRATDTTAEGLGLGNTRARLAGLYGDGARLDLAPAAGDRGTRVTIRLPTAAPGGATA